MSTGNEDGAMAVGAGHDQDGIVDTQTPAEDTTATAEGDAGGQTAGAADDQENDQPQDDAPEDVQEDDEAQEDDQEEQDDDEAAQDDEQGPETLDPPTPVTVTYGANTRQLSELVGRTIHESRRLVAEEMNVPVNPQARVGGLAVSHDYILRPGDRLEFIQPAGRKG